MNSAFVCLRQALGLLAPLLVGLICVDTAMAQPVPNRKYNQEDKFRQLEEILPTPTATERLLGNLAPTIGSKRQII